ncbi:MAG TPA: hypothetical protein VG890_18395 [Puia sp.]|nr:hypothetical protein [Puia sp.]
MRKYLILYLAAGYFLFACKKDHYISGPAVLNFSSDSVFFDTLFTSTGSVTQKIRIITRTIRNY